MGHEADSRNCHTEARDRRVLILSRGRRVRLDWPQPQSFEMLRCRRFWCELESGKGRSFARLCLFTLMSFQALWKRTRALERVPSQTLARLCQAVAGAEWVPDVLQAEPTTWRASSGRHCHVLSGVAGLWLSQGRVRPLDSMPYASPTLYILLRRGR